MTAEQFALWFQGFAELTPEPPNAEQWTLIRENIATALAACTGAVFASLAYQALITS